MKLLGTITEKQRIKKQIDQIIADVFTEFIEDDDVNLKERLKDEIYYLIQREIRRK